MTPDHLPTKQDLERARERQRVVNAYHRLFDSPDGKIVLADLARQFQLDRPAFLRGINGAFDPYAAAARDGNREVLLYVNLQLSHAAGGDGNIETPPVEVLTDK